MTDSTHAGAGDIIKSATGGIRVALGVSGAVALIIGIILLVWPARSAAVVAVFLGIYFVVAGIIRLAIGIFGREPSGGRRALDIVVGVLLIIVGIIALKNVAGATAALLLLVVAVIGVGWIIEGVLAIVQSGNTGSRVWAIIFGIISIIAGLLVLSVPGWSALSLIIVSGAALVVLGIVGIIRAITFKPEALEAALS
jgi:uncharacterized membrane protein HdeD (DUF308 family)